jgi:hypothetical protein
MRDRREMTTDWSLARLGCFGAYAALAATVVALPLITSSGAQCRFAGTPTQDYTGPVAEPGNTAGLVAFTIAPLVAFAALVLLAQGRRRGQPASRLARAAAILVFPLAFADFVLWAVKGAFGCGIGLM